MKRLGLLLMAFFALQPPADASAQSAPMAAGARVRVHAFDLSGASWAIEGGSGRLVGYLDRVGRDSLWIRLNSPVGPLLSIDRSTVRQLEISGGRKRHPGTGALVGTGAGLVMGLLAVAALDDCALGTDGWWFDLCDGDEDVLILGSMVAGAAWGTLVGLLITSERWVAVPPASLTLRPMRGGIGVGLEFSLRR